MKRCPSSRLFLLVSLFPLIGISTFAADAPNIVVLGAGEALTANIFNHLRIGDEGCDTSFQRLRRLTPQVRSNLQNAANALGYYQAESTISFSETEGCWSLEIEVSPGEPVILEDIEVSIQASDENAAVFQGAINESPLVPGAQLNHATYESFKNSLSNLAIENGFFAAQFATAEIRLDLVSNTADIIIEFAPGERFQFGQLTINYDGVLSDTFINRLVSFEEGMPYSNSELMQVRQNLDQSQYFSQVSIRPQLSASSNQAVPINIQLSPRARHSYTGGLGFTTDTGPRIRLAYENRYQTSNGHRLNADLSLSEVRSQANVNYNMPVGANPLRERIQYSVGSIHESNDSFDSERYILETSYQNESVSGWLRETFINHQRDNYQINLETNSSALTVLGYNVSRTSSDNVVNPNQGWRLFSEISGASSDLLSDTSFVQYVFRAKNIFSIGNRTRFISRVDAGATWIENELDLPASLRFFAGGDRSLRGYDYQSLGPVDDSGVVIGGSKLLTGGVELDYRFLEAWRAAVFYDTGNAFTKDSEMDWKHGVGIGIRWISPIGPLRIDLAHGLDDDRSIRLHVTMGPDL